MNIINKLSILSLFCLSLCLFCGCEGSGDLDDLKERTAILEEWCRNSNSEMSSLNILAAAISNADYITDVNPLSDGSGWSISFAKSGVITLYNGLSPHIGSNGNWWIDSTDTEIKAGASDGKDGSTPVISIEKGSDDIYYWKIDGKWLLDDEGEKIPVTDTAPIVKINAASKCWEISYDNGKTWISTGVVASGKSGFRVFSDDGITVNDLEVVFRLADGSTFSIPRSTPFRIGKDGSSDDILISPSGTEIPLDIPNELTESDLDAIVAKISSSSGTVSSIATRADSSPWSISVKMPTFINGKSSNDASVNVAPDSTITSADYAAVLEVIILKTSGHEISASRVIRYKSE